MATKMDSIAQADTETLLRLLPDFLRRLAAHYGTWYREVSHQLSREAAMEIESQVWPAVFSNNASRIGKILGIEMEGGLPASFKQMPKEAIIELLRAVAVNWLAMDGIWFQGMENRMGMNDAKRCNDTCWAQIAPYEAFCIKDLLGMEPLPGLAGLKTAFGFRMYALVNEQSIEEPEEGVLIFRMNKCRVQTARQRRKLPDYPCKSAGIVEYPYFARAIDPRIKTECLGCPPDPHPPEWVCAWKFTISE